MQEFGHVMHFSSIIMCGRAEEYTGVRRKSDPPLKKLVGSINCTKMKICSPGGTKRNQRSVYLGYKSMHFLIYQTICSPDGLMFCLYATVEGGRHE